MEKARAQLLALKPTDTWISSGQPFQLDQRRRRTSSTPNDNTTGESHRIFSDHTRYIAALYTPGPAANFAHNHPPNLRPEPATKTSQLAGPHTNEHLQSSWERESQEDCSPPASCATLAVSSNGPICTTRRDCSVPPTSHRHSEYVHPDDIMMEEMEGTRE